MCDTILPEGFYQEPYRQAFLMNPTFFPPDPRLPMDRIGLPAECVFHTPGEPARCSDECAEYVPELFGYITAYRVDRSACGDAGTTPDAGVDGGTPVWPATSGTSC